MEDVEVRNYIQGVRVSGRHAQHVGRGLEAAMPPDADAGERAAVARVVTAGDAVQERLIERGRTGTARVRPALIAFAAIWSVVGDVLLSLARATGLTPRAERAQGLYAKVFPEGTAFVKDDAGAAWAAGERTLTVIDREGLAAELAALVGGPDLLESARRATAELRDAAGAGPSPRDGASTTALGAAVADFSHHVGLYCRLLAAKVDERDPASVERFKKAVRPLDDYRASRRGEGNDDEDEAPVTPPVAPGMPGGSPFMPRPE